MSSSQRVISQDDADKGFGLLQDIVNMVKNPKAISDAYEARQKIAELTDDEVKKSNDARDLIGKADVLRSDIKNAQDSVDESKAQYEKDVSSLSARITSENTRLAEWENRLNLLQQQIQDNTDKLAEDREKFDSDSQQVKSNQDNRSSTLDLREKSISDGESANLNEANRLLEWENKIKAKAASLAALASS